jgi:prepilin-type N-terminal cleavage/methylation domain-containing protein
MKKQSGFSLLELLMVVVIIGVIAAIAIPGLRRARQNAYMGSAIQSLRVITTAQHLYERKYKVYATLAQLIPEGSIDTNLGNGSKSNYSFNITLGAGSKSFTCTASPQEDQSVLDYFFVDESGVIRFNTGAPADVTSMPIPR